MGKGWEVRPRESGRRAAWRPGVSQEEAELVPNTALCGFAELGVALACKGTRRLGREKRGWETDLTAVTRGRCWCVRSHETPPLCGSRDQARSKDRKRGRTSLAWLLGLVCTDWEPVGVGVAPGQSAFERAKKGPQRNPGFSGKPTAAR